MWKSFVSWLFESVSVENWVLVLWLFFAAIQCAVEIKRLAKHVAGEE